MYRIDTVLSLILLVSEMLKIPRAKVEVHFLKKLAFVTNKCLAHNAFRKFPRATENLSKYIATRTVMCTNFLIISHIVNSKIIYVMHLLTLKRLTLVNASA